MNGWRRRSDSDSDSDSRLHIKRVKILFKKAHTHTHTHTAHMNMNMGSSSPPVHNKIDPPSESRNHVCLSLSPFRPPVCVPCLPACLPAADCWCLLLLCLFSPYIYTHIYLLLPPNYLPIVESRFLHARSSNPSDHHKPFFHAIPCHFTSPPSITSRNLSTEAYVHISIYAARHSVRKRYMR